MHYRISFQNPLTHFIHISLEIPRSNAPSTRLCLPAWRPGRYEMANFAKNIRDFSVTDGKGNPIPHMKVSKDCWQVDSGTDLLVHYEYYAYQMDAGSSWLDEEQLYINFINCMLYVEGRMEEACHVTLDIPEDYEIACGLPQPKRHLLFAEDYYRLVDSPMMASPSLQHLTYDVDGKGFHLWVQGECTIGAEKVLTAFEGFTRVQAEVFGGIPFQDYHFLYQMLPYRHYHGVEHFNSTVITLGPGPDLHEAKMYDDFMGISSHELFHAWNIIRIRPEALNPYDFSQENYFKTGYVAEGFTTYYGDLFLIRGKVFDKTWYFTELEKLFHRHFDNYGRFHLSVMDASFDLWLDGYVAGVPHRKTSIYTKGAIVALMLDLEIRSLTKNECSLDDLMRLLWENHGKACQGYTHEDVLAYASKVARQPMEAFFKDYLEGTAALEGPLKKLLGTAGLNLVMSPSPHWCESGFGFKVVLENDRLKVRDIAPGSPAETLLSIGDVLLEAGGQPIGGDGKDKNAPHHLDSIQGLETVCFKILRNHKEHMIEITSEPALYFHQLKVEPFAEVTPEQAETFKKWLGCEM